MITLGINYSQMHDSSACLVRLRKAIGEPTPTDSLVERKAEVST